MSFLSLGIIIIIIITIIIIIITITISINDIISDTTIKQQAINHLDEFKHRNNN